MRAIVTDEQRRSRGEAGLPDRIDASPWRGNLLRKGPGAFARRAASLLGYDVPHRALVAPGRPAKSPGPMTRYL